MNNGNLKSKSGALVVGIAHEIDCSLLVKNLKSDNQVNARFDKLLAEHTHESHGYDA